MPKFIDRTGVVYGKLTALELVGRDKIGKTVWKCRCECGAELNVVSGSLASGNTQSCGCYFKERVTKHGGSSKGSYNTWRAMMRRCTVPTDKDYPRYGAMGVVVCAEWFNYAKFVEDMGEPQGDETLDRINAYGNYEPSNCRWAGLRTQNRNLRIRANSKTGVTGVSMVGDRFMAKITVGRKAYYSKVLPTLEAATQARKELEAKYWIADYG
jgi:hypothetical protein